MSKRVIWIGSADFTGNGEILTLKFKVADDAAGSNEVSLSYGKGDVCNYNEEDVEFALVPGGVTVGFTGDVSGDGMITIRDLSDLKLLLAGSTEGTFVLANCDINGDGLITIADISALKILLA